MANFAKGSLGIFFVKFLLWRWNFQWNHLKTVSNSAVCWFVRKSSSTCSEIFKFLFLQIHTISDPVINCVQPFFLRYLKNTSDTPLMFSTLNTDLGLWKFHLVISQISIQCNPLYPKAICCNLFWQSSANITFRVKKWIETWRGKGMWKSTLDFFFINEDI